MDSGHSGEIFRPTDVITTFFFRPVINKKLPTYAQIKECIHLDAPFTYQQGTLTANGRLKRNVILENLLTNKQELERELYEIL